MTRSSKTIDVYLEIEKKRTFAGVAGVTKQKSSSM